MNSPIKIDPDKVIRVSPIVIREGQCTEDSGKPLMWHYYKLRCNLSYWLSNNVIDDDAACYFLRGYYYWLEKVCKQGFNLYGTRITPNQTPDKI